MSEPDNVCPTCGRSWPVDRMPHGTCAFMTLDASHAIGLTMALPASSNPHLGCKGWTEED